MFRSLLSLLLLLFIALQCNAQLPLLRHYTINDGLPSNNIYTTYQDDRGFIWVCTDWGISRFDGHRFETITSDNGLPDNDVFRMITDSWKRYWLLCYNKAPAYILNGKVHTAQNDRLCRFMEHKGMRYSNAYINSNNDLCLVGKENYIVKKDTVVPDAASAALHCRGYQFQYKGVHYFLDDAVFYSETGNVKTDIFKTEGAFKTAFFRKGHVYLAINSERTFRSKAKRFYDIDLETGHPIIKEHKIPYLIFNFTPGRHNEIWCCTDHGVFRCDPKNESVSDKQLVAMNGIVTYHAFIDNQNNAWYATAQGLYMQSVNTTSEYNTTTGLSGNNVAAITYMPDGSLLAGYDNGIIDIITAGKTRSMHISASAKWNRIKYLLPYNTQTFFAGTDGGLYKTDLQTGKITMPNIYAQKSGYVSDGILLAGFHGGNSGGSAMYDIALNKWNYLPLIGTRTDAVIATATDDNKTYWLGTLEGLYFYSNGVIQKLNKDSVLSHSRITSVIPLPHHRLVVATFSNGAFLMDSNRIIHLTKENGLSSNIIRKAYVDERERIWLNTGKGLERITWNGNLHPAVYHLSIADGVPDYIINDLALGNGKAFLATPKGIMIMNQDQTGGSIPYRVYILSATIKDSTINFPEQINLSYKQNNVRIHFTAISYTEGSDVTYKYLLRGASSDTIETKEGILNLGALKPGSYKLLVWGLGKNNNRNKIPAMLSIIVRPPFWASTWFVFLMICCLYAGILLIYKSSIRIIRKKEKEKAERKRAIAELEMQALRAQINPHFMFNALNAIQNYYNRNDELSANYYMSSFARLIRQTLHYSKEHWISIEDEMSMLKTYIELEQMRFKNAFTYEMNIAPDTAQCKIPTMLLQIYTENAINHGLRHLTEPGKLLISCGKKDGVVICTIDDNGVGFDKARLLDSRPGEHQSMGLKMTANRIATINDLYGTSITSEIIDKQILDKNQHGTIIKISIHQAPEI